MALSVMIRRPMVVFGITVPIMTVGMLTLMIVVVVAMRVLIIAE